MKKYFILATLSTLLCSQFVHGADTYMMGQSRQRHVNVNNRILAVVNGKPLSVYDVMKKMDVHFYRQFPEYASSAEARYQFYQAQWKPMLRDLIDKELVLADAEASKIEVSNGDVRQEMETMFGPNIIATLDKLGMTFTEAESIIQGDIVLRRMLFMRVQNKAMRKVTPQVIRRAYEAYAKENIEPSQWKYHVISIRDDDASRGAETANIAYRLLTEDLIGINQLKNKLNELGNIVNAHSVNISEEFSHSEKEVSSAYKEVLSQLKPGIYSAPTAQSSRRDTGKVFRIFFMKEMVPGGVQSFNSLEHKLKDKLLDQLMDKETAAYLKQLREHYHVKDSDITSAIPDGFEPFTLK